VADDKQKLALAHGLIAQAVHEGTERTIALETALQACRVIAKYNLLPPAAPKEAPPPERAPPQPRRPRAPPPPAPPHVDAEPIDDWFAETFGGFATEFPGEEYWKKGEPIPDSHDGIPPPVQPPPNFERLRNGKFMAARHKGKCRWCSLDFARGDPIYWDSQLGPDHADCARERQQVEEMNLG